MGEAEANLPESLRRVSDGHPLKILANGLVIIRRKKHEPIDMTGLSRQDIVDWTSKRSGSKFSSDWTLVRCVQWIEDQVTALGWTPETGPVTTTVVFEQTVGISAGKNACTIRLRSDGRYVHAYPEE